MKHVALSCQLPASRHIFWHISIHFNQVDNVVVVNFWLMFFDSVIDQNGTMSLFATRNAWIMFYRLLGHLLFKAWSNQRLLTRGNLEVKLATSGRKVGSLKRVQNRLVRWEIKHCTPLWCKTRFQINFAKTSEHVRTLLEVELLKNWRRQCRIAGSQVKMWKRQRVRNAFGSWIVQ